MATALTRLSNMDFQTRPEGPSHGRGPSFPPSQASKITITNLTCDPPPPSSPPTAPSLFHEHHTSFNTIRATKNAPSLPALTITKRPSPISSPSPPLTPHSHITMAPKPKVEYDPKLLFQKHQLDNKFPTSRLLARVQEVGGSAALQQSREDVLRNFNRDNRAGMEVLNQEKIERDLLEKAEAKKKKEEEDERKRLEAEEAGDSNPVVDLEEAEEESVARRTRRRSTRAETTRYATHLDQTHMKILANGSSSGTPGPDATGSTLSMPGGKTTGTTSSARPGKTSTSHGGATPSARSTTARESNLSPHPCPNKQLTLSSDGTRRPAPRFPPHRAPTSAPPPTTASSPDPPPTSSPANFTTATPTSSGAPTRGRGRPRGTGHTEPKCLNCQKDKKGCDRGRPCAMCVQKKKKECVYPGDREGDGDVVMTGGDDDEDDRETQTGPGAGAGFFGGFGGGAGSFATNAEVRRYSAPFGEPNMPSNPSQRRPTMPDVYGSNAPSGSNAVFRSQLPGLEHLFAIPDIGRVRETERAPDREVPAWARPDYQPLRFQGGRDLNFGLDGANDSRGSGNRVGPHLNYGIDLTSYGLLNQNYNHPTANTGYPYGNPASNSGDQSNYRPPHSTASHQTSHNEDNKNPRRSGRGSSGRDSGSGSGGHGSGGNGGGDKRRGGTAVAPEDDGDDSGDESSDSALSENSARTPSPRRPRTRKTGKDEDDDEDIGDQDDDDEDDGDDQDNSNNAAMRRHMKRARRMENDPSKEARGKACRFCRAGKRPGCLWDEKHGCCTRCWAAHNGGDCFYWGEHLGLANTCCHNCRNGRISRDCDHGRPCSACVEAGKANQCFYDGDDTDEDNEQVKKDYVPDQNGGRNPADRAAARRAKKAAEAAAAADEDEDAPKGQQKRKRDADDDAQKGKKKRTKAVHNEDDSDEVLRDVDDDDDDEELYKPGPTLSRSNGRGGVRSTPVTTTAPKTNKTLGQTRKTSTATQTNKTSGQSRKTSTGQGSSNRQAVHTGFTPTEQSFRKLALQSPTEHPVVRIGRGSINPLVAEAQALADKISAPSGEPSATPSIQPRGRTRQRDVELLPPLLHPSSRPRPITPNSRKDTARYINETTVAYLARARKENLQRLEDVKDNTIEKQDRTLLEAIFSVATRASSNLGPDDPEDVELHICDVSDADHLLDPKNDKIPRDIPLLVRGAQMFRFRDEEEYGRPIIQFLGTFGDDDFIQVQDPGRAQNSTKKVTDTSIKALRQRITGEAQRKFPYNALDLPIKYGNAGFIPPIFIAGQEDASLLTDIDNHIKSNSIVKIGSKMVEGGSEVASRTNSTPRSDRIQPFADKLMIALCAEGGSCTAPHQDAFGYRTWVTAQDGNLLWLWLHRPTEEQQVAVFDAIAGSRKMPDYLPWVGVVLEPDWTLTMPPGTIHAVVRVKQEHTLLFAGHYLCRSEVVKWLDTIILQKQHPTSRNEEDGEGVRQLVKVVKEMLVKVKAGGCSGLKAEDFGGKRVVEEALRKIRTFEEMEIEEEL
ncbi:hypothetical protein KVT40_003538 [Elsinoe batatas]|uniref:Zn(2)-C6 fungal-type domain-containing protein n=1 Tax=Elsinoe batatas TaxID=2601811 RepID=A0A8K0L7R6_9PEZI|nr:hypothetical protein KVT40_003538 [Elsinoe batatas]